MHLLVGFEDNGVLIVISSLLLVSLVTSEVEMEGVPYYD